MSNPRTPAGQLFYGPMYGDRLAQQIPHLTGQNPATIARMRRNYGRYLAGFGHNGYGASSDGGPLIMLAMTLMTVPAIVAAAWVGKSKQSVAWGAGAGVTAALITLLIRDRV